MVTKIIDAHSHILLNKGIEESKEMILYSMKKYNVNYSLVSMDGTEYNDKEHFYDLVSSVKGTKITLDFAKNNMDSIGILIWIRPHKEKNAPIEELEKLIINNRNLIHGLKFHPYCSRLKVTSKLLIPYFKLARKYNLPILVHTANDKYSSIYYLRKVALANKDITFIAAHLELLSDNKYALDVLKETENIYGDTAWVDPKKYRLIKNRHLEDKIMFGTDNPIDGKDTLNHPWYKKYLHHKFKINDEDYEKLMYLNAKKVYKIDLK